MKTISNQTNQGSISHLPQLASSALDNKKAQNINILHLKDSGMADCLVIATATSSTHAMALADEVVETLKAAGEQILSVEGRAEWILVDAGSIVVHIFSEEARALYNLDKLWLQFDDDDDDFEEQTG